MSFITPSMLVDCKRVHCCYRSTDFSELGLENSEEKMLWCTRIGAETVPNL